MQRRLGLLLSSAALLAACSQTYDVNPIGQGAIAAVVREIKREVGEYQLAAHYYKYNQSADPALQGLPRDSDGKIIYACGRGKIDFFIFKVKIELTTTDDDTAQGGFGLTIPIFAGTGSIGPSFDTSKENAATQKLDFTAYPIQPKPSDLVASFDPNAKRGPIAQTLLNLRGALVQASVAGPCFTPKPGAPGIGNEPFFDKIPPDSPLARRLRALAGKRPAAPAAQPAAAKKPGATPAAAADANGDPTDNSITLGITVTKVTDESIKITAAVVTANVGGTKKSISGNTITVTFSPTSD